VPKRPTIAPPILLRLLGMPLLAASCGDGTLLVLGDRDPPALHFAAPRRVAELSSPSRNDNPSLTADQLEIYFTSERGGVPADIWRAQRSDPAQPFGQPELVAELNSPRNETSPVISADGLTCWLASDRAGGRGDLDIWVATREARTATWSPARNLSELNSAGKDIPRPPGQHELVMPLASDRDTRGYYQIYFATRSAPSAAFAAPQPLEELAAPAASTVDGFLSDDGLRLFFVRGPAVGPADLFVATRRTSSSQFADAVALDELNTPSDERDPFLSADGQTFYFSSDRSGQYEIYVTRLLAE
jgi:hypothetical protein